ncbi:MAG TPA: prepilin-type N-terminal cleavage/methylation domain-containing protein [Candidatus Anammoximicrobium sp.]|nr:prepilin-type N-terminal cleavage/methylation domain-containing protein [Candidatus Anammoximicrobium sp.]
MKGPFPVRDFRPGRRASDSPPPSSRRQRPKGLQNPRDLQSDVSARSGDLRRASPRRGLSLLEVILAVAILGGCLAVTGELVRMGVRHAEEARELTRAQLLCESKMEEIAAGVTGLESASMVPFETDPEWTYTVEVSPLDQQLLTLVRVTVQELESNRLYPITFTLSRWILNSTSTTDATSTETTTEGQAATSGTSSDGSN